MWQHVSFGGVLWEMLTVMIHIAWHQDALKGKKLKGTCLNADFRRSWLIPSIF